MVAAVFGAWYALTPPYPPPGAQERLGSGSVERSFRSVVRFHRLIWKVYLTSQTLTARSLYTSRDLLTPPPPTPPRIPPRTQTPLATTTRTGAPAAFVLGCLVTAASGVLRLVCYKTLGSLYTFELTLREDHRLVTNGPYAFVRHPGYSGVVLRVVGTLLVHFGPASWWARAGWLGTVGGQAYALAWCSVEAYVLWNILCRARMEDAFLRKRFGAEWDAWAERVPYRVIPGVF
ncbi:hypothetical protein V8E53_004502 [Lactarius tabidus]